MQSGSGLAHWAINYEKHLIDIAKDTREDQEMLRKIYKNSKYINSINDTILNFLTITSCNITEKHICMKKKLQIYLESNHSYNFEKEYRDLFAEKVKIIENNETLKNLNILALKIKEFEMKETLDNLFMTVTNFEDLSNNQFNQCCLNFI